MKAAVLHGTKDLRIEEVEAPTPGEGDVLIRVTYNGLCGTDASEYGRGQKMVPLQAEHPGSGHAGPTILGHEFIGEVVAAGAGAEHLIGRRVACGAGVSCGECGWCADGRTNLCESYYTLGLSTHGGLAELVAAPAAICAEIPDGCSDEDAALAQPLAVGLHAVHRAEVPDGSTVVLLGAGAIGSFISVALRDRPCHVVAFDIDEDRLAAIRSLGADEAHLVDREATGEDLRALLPAGAARVFETSGVPGAAGRAAALAARGGRVMLVGLTPGLEQLPLTSLILDEIDLHTTVAHVCGTDLPAALDILASWPLSEQLVGDIVSLDRVVEDGLEPLLEGRARGKTLVEPNHD